MAQKPSIPKGTRDFTPVEMARRDYIFSTIKSVFKLYGYSPIETPAIENLSTLLGKYGDEGDKLLFKILNSGNAFDNIEPTLLKDSSALSLKVCEKGLRYDLTVPFARFVVQHQNELQFPFKRYQIQPVWRADRPQKGRYREFYQCDVDVVGSNSLLNELELVQIADDVFARFGISVVIKINNRKILSGLAEVAGCPEKLTDITIAIDKIDKVGLEEVKKELMEKGIGDDAINTIEPVLLLSGSNQSKLEVMRRILEKSQTGLLGVDEMTKLFGMIEVAEINQKVEFDLSLARGLNYYTGAIFEVKALDAEIGSICGGGRYDDLTGIFGLKGLSGVGISFGADRIYDVLLSLHKFPNEAINTSQLLFANLGDEDVLFALPIIKKLRAKGIIAEIYPDPVKLKKQFEYAERKNIKFMIIAGKEEIDRGVLNIKEIQTGEQVQIAINNLIDYIESNKI
jgi:histidyl-tRNA synthetase